tara:strand:- start:217 stop:798 length:582 start_codon:yes stop_codon:yes gene_type:complete
VIALCKNALQANEYLQTHQIDLIFLDINMPVVSGVHWLKTLKNSPSVLMTTAYTEYALESFSYNVIDYLVKPISFERFLQAPFKVHNYFGSDTSKELLFIKSDKQLKKVRISDILFVEAMQNYIKIVTIDKSITTHMSLKIIKDILPDYFIKTHKSYVVSKYNVDKIVGNHLVIKHHKIPMSVRLKKEVLRSF